MLLKVNDVFERIFVNQEKNIIEMIINARKKRDMHQKMMLEADKKAKKEQMIQMLLQNKGLLH
jgi:hypothetical protein